MANAFENLIRRDRQQVWHPYSSMINAPPVFPVVSASGVRIKLADGRELIDGMASWWCAIHGYNHPDLNQAAARQLDNMSHVMFGGLTHEPAVALAGELVRITPAKLETVFFCDSGSVAVEVAMKMAVQYWAVRGRPARRKFLTIKGGYHGDTFGAMSVCDPVTGMHTLFNGVLAQQLFAERPAVPFDGNWDESDIRSFADLIESHADDIAAVILEPIVQGAGGMWFYHPEYLKRVRALCDHYEILLIADEIATGFGRAGKLFACEYAGIAPDILCLGKALTGGYLSLAATLCSRRVAETISDGGRGVFMHGPTFMANPLACSVALAGLGLLEAYPWQEKIAAMEKQLTEELAPCRELDNVKEVRVLGGIGVVELNSSVDMHTIPGRFVERGVWIRPFGRLVYIMPPYIIAADDLRRLTTAMYDVIKGL